MPFLAVLNVLIALMMYICLCNDQAWAFEGDHNVYEDNEPNLKNTISYTTNIVTSTTKCECANTLPRKRNSWECSLSIMERYILSVHLWPLVCFYHVYLSTTIPHQINWWKIHSCCTWTSKETLSKRRYLN